MYPLPLGKMLFYSLLLFVYLSILMRVYPRWFCYPYLLFTTTFVIGGITSIVAMVTNYFSEHDTIFIKKHCSYPELRSRLRWAVAVVTAEYSENDIYSNEAIYRRTINVPVYHIKFDGFIAITVLVIQCHMSINEW